MPDTFIPIPVETVKEAEEKPSRTYRLDLDNGRIVGKVDGLTAVNQAIRKAIITPRFKCLIYDHQYGSEIEDAIIAKDATRDYIEAATEGFVKDALFKRDKGNEKPRKDVLAEEEEGDIIVVGSDEPVSMRAMKKVTGRRTKSAPTARESIFRRAANFFFGGKNRPQAEQDKTEGEDGEELDAGNE